jgi:hypothetical protein
MLTLICVALLGQPAIEPTAPGWMYPGARYVSRGGGSAGGALGPNSEHCHYSALVSDDFPTVLRFFANKAVGSLDLSRGRPIQLGLVLFHCGDTSVVVLVSRAKQDAETHIALSYHRGRLDAERPMPLGLAYPGTALDLERGLVATHDAYDVVLKFYQEKAGAVRADGTLLENGGISGPERNVDVLDCTLRRPIKLKLIVQRWQAAVAASVISRAQGEDETLITNIYRGPGWPAIAEQPPDVIGDFKVKEWSYPGDCVIQELGRPRPVGPEFDEIAARLGWRVSTTADPFDKVVEHYSVLAGMGKLRPGAGGGNDQASLLTFSHGRPVQLAVISRRYDMLAVTVIVSRAEGEERTQIELIYNRPTIKP